MERIYMQSSAKDIPVPSREVYTKALIAKTNSFIKRVRWRIFYAERKDDDLAKLEKRHKSLAKDCEERGLKLKVKIFFKCNKNKFL